MAGALSNVDAIALPLVARLPNHPSLRKKASEKLRSFSLARLWMVIELCSRTAGGPGLKATGSKGSANYC